MTTIDQSQSVASLAVGVPGAARVLELRRIDYCCAGQRTLAEACDLRGCPVEEVVAELGHAANDAPEPADAHWNSVTMAALIAHLLDKHHRFASTELARLDPIVSKVLRVHGSEHPELQQVSNLFGELRNDLLGHMQKEEVVLFPYLVELEQQGRQAESPFGDIANPLRVMHEEHETAGRLLRELRAVTGDYTLPVGACATYAVLYRGLEALEADLHRHIHLENNLLFPRAVQESQVAR